MKKLILIDGNAILHRAYHSLPPFKTSSGESTNAIVGFLRMLIDLYKREKPQYIAIAWGRAAPPVLHQEYREYKATRSAPPDDLYPQLPPLKQILEAFHVPSLELDGYEADDILGTLVQYGEKNPELAITIVTGDRDALQLVSNQTHVLMPISGISEVLIYNPEKVKEKFGIYPIQVIDYKALCGDQSDNIPGVPGIGPKQAQELLQKYETLENIYLNIDELPEGQNKKLTSGKTSALLSKKLVTLELHVPIVFQLEQASCNNIDYEKVKQLLLSLEIKSLDKKLDELKKLCDGNNSLQQSLF